MSNSPFKVVAYFLASLVVCNFDNYKEITKEPGTLTNDEHSSREKRKNIRESISQRETKNFWSKTSERDPTNKVSERTKNDEDADVDAESQTNWIASEINALVKFKEKNYQNCHARPNFTPWRKENGWKRGGPPVLTFLLSIIYIVIHYTYSQPYIAKAHSLSFSNSSLAFVPSKNSEVWRYLTYQLLHRDGKHLFSNIGVLIYFGIFLESFHGHYVMLGIYNMGVVIGAMSTFLFDVEKNPALNNTIGCSAGVYCLMTAHIADFRLNMDTMKKREWAGYLIFHTPILIISVMEIVECINQEVDGDQVAYSWSAHLGGAITGLFFSPMFLHNTKEEIEERTSKHFWFGIFVGFGSVLFLLQLTKAGMFKHLLGIFSH